MNNKSMIYKNICVCLIGLPVSIDVSKQDSIYVEIIFGKNYLLHSTLLKLILQCTYSVLKKCRPQQLIFNVIE